MADLRTLAVVAKLPTCDFCQEEGIERPARYDFRTRYGPWANGCAQHYEQHRAHESLGEGQGQYLMRGNEMPDALPQ